MANKNTLEETVGGLKQNYTARVEAPNQFVPKQSARVARTQAISRDIGKILNVATDITQERERLTDEAVKRHAIDTLANHTNQVMAIDSDLKMMDQRQPAMSQASSLLSENIGGNAYEDPAKQEIFNKYFTKPATEQLSRQYNKWSGEQDQIDKTNWISNTEYELFSIFQPGSGVDGETRREILDEKIKQARAFGINPATFELAQAKKTTSAFDSDLQANPSAFLQGVLNDNGTVNMEMAKAKFDTYFDGLATYNIETNDIDYTTDNTHVQKEIARSMDAFVAAASTESSGRKTDINNLFKIAVDSNIHKGLKYESKSVIGGQNVVYKLEPDDEKAWNDVVQVSIDNNVPIPIAIEKYFTDKRVVDGGISPETVQEAIMSNTPMGSSVDWTAVTEDTRDKVAQERSSNWLSAVQHYEQRASDQQNPMTQEETIAALNIQKEWTNGKNGASNALSAGSMVDGILKSPGMMEGYNTWLANRRFTKSDYFDSYAADISEDKMALYRLYDAEYERYHAAKRMNPNTPDLDFSEKIPELKAISQRKFTTEIAKRVSDGKDYVNDNLEGSAFMVTDDLKKSRLALENHLAANGEQSIDASKEFKSLYKTELTTPQNNTFVYRLSEKDIKNGEDPLHNFVNSVVNTGSETTNQYARNLPKHVLITAKKMNIPGNVIESMENNGYMIVPTTENGQPVRGKIDVLEHEVNGQKQNIKMPGMYDVYFINDAGKSVKSGYRIDMSVWDGTISAEDEKSFSHDVPLPETVMRRQDLF